MNSRSFVIFAAVLLALAGTSVVAASASPRDGLDLKAAKRVLPDAQQGRKALQGMSAADVAEAAKRNGRSVENFRGLLSHDDTAWVNSKGMIFYVDRADSAQMAAADAQSVPQSAAAWATFPESQTFLLHSKPGSAHTAFLDFDGYNLPMNAAWTDPLLDGQHPNAIIPAGNYGGFSLDGSAAFSSAELAYIQTVWRIVSEKYAAFDIDVTTEQPSSDALNRLPDTDTTYGTRVVITNDMNARGGVCTASPGGGCVGIAWIDVFDAEANDFGYGTDGMEPAWVYTKFTAASPVFSAGAVGNTAAHELGHTLGLDHDTTSADPNGYYSGHDNWFAIMGSSNRAVGHFTNGTSYPDAFTFQVDPDTGQDDADDVDVITKAGAPLRTDDIAGTKALGKATSYSQDGIVERRTDTDTFSVDRTCTSTLTAAASGIGLGQAVDLKVTVRNPSGAAAAAADPATSGDTSTDPNTPVNMNATATAAGAGTGLWTVTVEGVGLGDPSTTGYTDYGSIGMYHLDVSGCPNLPSAPGTPSASAGDGQVFVSWSEPSALGNGSFLKWEVYDAATNTLVCTQTTQASKFCNVTGLVNGTTYSYKVRAVNTFGNGPFSAASNDATPFVPVSGAFVSVAPFRLLDSRPAPDNVGIAVGKIPAHTDATFQVAGRGGVPAAAETTHAAAVVLNVAVTGATAPGVVTAHPSNEAAPTAANLNYVAGQTISNHVTVKLSPDGKASLLNDSNAAIHLIADVNGWYAAGSATDPGTFTPMTPKRLLDTRPPPDNVGVAPGKIPGQGTVDFAVAGVAPIPAAQVGAGVFNLAVTAPTMAGFVTGYPTGTSKPNAANLNYVAGQTISNAATIKLGTGGKVTLANGQLNPSTNAHYIADANGWFRAGAATVAGAYSPLNPARILDTRDGTGQNNVVAKVPANGSVTLTIAGVSGVPASGVGAAVFNLAVTGTSAPGVITAHPADAGTPLTANLNYATGETISNLVTAKLSSDGKVKLVNTGGQPVDLVADIAGYYKK